MENHVGNDSIRVLLLYELAFANFQSDLEATKFYIEKAEVLSDSLNYTKGKAKILYLQGILENRKSNYTASLNLFERSLELNQSINNLEGIAGNYTAFGITQYDQSQYDEALKSYNKAFEVYKKLGNQRELITILINMANAYTEIGKYNEAIIQYKKALGQSVAIKDDDGISYVHSNLGGVYKTRGNYPKAIEYYNKSLEYNKRTSDSWSIATTLNNLGEIYTLIGQENKALDYLEESLSISEQNDFKSIIALNNINIGNIYKNEKDYEEALEYYRISLATSQEINNLKQVAICFQNIGAVNLLIKRPSIARENFVLANNINRKIDNKSGIAYDYLGISESYILEQQYDNALSYILKGRKVAQALNLFETQKKAEELLSEVYRNMGQYKKAFESHKQFKILNDSLFNKENIEKIAQLEYEYKYKQALDSASIRELKLNKTILSTSQDLAKTKQNYLWAVIGFLVTSIMSGSFVFYQKYRSVKIKNQHIVTEQKLLRSQMTPHFIFNSLSVLQGMVLNKEVKKSITYLSKFSKLLRIVLENSRDKVVPLIQELDAIDNYMILQNLDAYPPYDYSLVVDENIDINLFLVPPMLIQPFIENAIEHAYLPDQENREINVHISFTHNELSCTIVDNGIGIDAISTKTNGNKKSLATTITRERLQLLAKDFQMPGDVKIEDRIKDNVRGTKVALVIPYKLNPASA
ncbi:tetratricopeptide repeat protein [Maribacter algicola]|uniref:Tetratricopeptide repeat protein n=1 Tax=Meishania litoralis TaxID=3434685 RepID=A0ACC7LH94_9FLAO